MIFIIIVTKCNYAKFAAAGVGKCSSRFMSEHDGCGGCYCGEEDLGHQL